MNINDVGVSYPPAMREMLIMPQTGGAYDSQGRWCSPPSQLDTYAVSENVKLISQHQLQQQGETERLKTAVSEKFAELESRVNDAMALMYYTIKYYPNVVEEFRAAEKTKPRIGVEEQKVS